MPEKSSENPLFDAMLITLAKATTAAKSQPPTCPWAGCRASDGATRAALAWTEALTRLSDTHAPDADYELLNQHFTPKEMVDLTVAISTINSWNRLAVGFRKMPQA